MENNNGKIITVSFMITGLLVGYVVSYAMNTVAAMSSGNLAHVLNRDLVHHGVPVLVGLLVFLSLQFKKSVVEWADEVVTELKKIVWPSRKDTTSMTIVVCIMVLISGFVIGLFDFASGNVIDWLLHINFQSIF